MLKLPAGLLALTLVIAAATLPATSWAQPVKPKPAAPAAAGIDPANEAEDSARAGKKVKTEGEKAEGSKTKPKTAADIDDEKPSPSTTTGNPASPAAPATLPPPRDR
jgi:hypothetical protein